MAVQTLPDVSPTVSVCASLALAGAGMGLATASATSAALSEEQGGIGSAPLQALNKTGGPLGIAILGSVLSSAYLAHLDLSGLPPAVAAVARESNFGAATVAQSMPRIQRGAAPLRDHQQQRSLLPPVQ